MFKWHYVGSNVMGRISGQWRNGQCILRSRVRVPSGSLLVSLWDSASDFGSADVLDRKVEKQGIVPCASCMLSTRSTIWATSPSSNRFGGYIFDWFSTLTKQKSYEFHHLRCISPINSGSKGSGSWPVRGFEPWTRAYFARQSRLARYK
jgi:hypothetical protein